MKKIPTSYLVIPALVFLFTNICLYFAFNAQEWLKTLIVPPFTPPYWVMQSLWHLVNVLAAISGIQVWEKMKRTSTFHFIFFCFFAVMGIDILASYSIYQTHMLEWAPVIFVMLTALLSIIIGLLWRTLPIAAYLLIPMALWDAFRIYGFWTLNQLN